MKHLTTLQEKGHVKISHQRQSTPINLYYEVHGTGPEGVLLVMGTVFMHISVEKIERN